MFARKGYFASRVSDIAEEAGVAHGLLYHYFASKEEVLETVFRDTWRELLDAIREVEESEESAREMLRKVAAIFLRAWRRDPDLVHVLVREIGRNAQMQEHVDEVGHVQAIERIVSRGQHAGEFRPDLDARLAAWIFYGAIDQILTAWVLDRLPHGDEEIARAERTVVEVVCGGFERAREAATA